jgi:DNA-binding response OmpR family regulator
MMDVTRLGMDADGELFMEMQPPLKDSPCGEGTPMRVLIIENDRKIVELLRKGLEEENHVVSAACDGASGLELGELHHFDVIALDWMLPEVDGPRAARRLRTSNRPTPILVLTARDAILDIVKGLDAGVDDCVTKPFSFAEFLAGQRALARRPQNIPVRRFEVRDLTLDLDSGRVFRGHKEIHLTRTEYRLLEFLIERSGRVASRRAIIEAVWGIETTIKGNTLDAFVRLLREKVDHGYDLKLIHTVRGLGYSLRPEAEE